ncbi:MAG: DUF177 domain-containing protein [Actinobacteria bacterium]|nr:DUF177 domain-containing protein [Actinomycetota bacterium]
MPPLTDQLDLDRMGLKPGGGSRFEIAVRVGEFVFGHQHYSLADDPLPVLVDASRTTSGFVVRVRAKPQIEGPCMRCSDDFGLALKIDHSEVHEPALDGELASDYVEEGKLLNVAALVRDAVGLALPPSISGPLDEHGQCTACDRTHEQLLELGVAGEQDVAELEQREQHAPDPRWAKLRELEL